MCIDMAIKGDSEQNKMGGGQRAYVTESEDHLRTK